MTLSRRQLLASLPLVGIAASARAQRRSDPWELADRIRAEIAVPRFPERRFVITDYGAVADGSTLATEAFRRAIAACSDAGGGIVDVPAGAYLTGAIHLRSNVNLHLAEGAVVRFSTDPEHYLPAVFTRWEGVEYYGYSPLVYAYRAENIAVTGRGVLDGQASNETWWA